MYHDYQIAHRAPLRLVAMIKVSVSMDMFFFSSCCLTENTHDADKELDLKRGWVLPGENHKLRNWKGSRRHIQEST